jgi:L-fuconolactonase
VIVDAQVHIWEPEREDRPWPPWGNKYVHRNGRPLTAEELLDDMAVAGVDRAILVPPSWEGDRNDVVLAAAERYPDRFGVMGRIKLDADDSREEMASWRATPGMLGIRVLFVHHGTAEWLTDGTADWFWPEAEKAGIPVAVLAPGQGKQIGAIAHAHPSLRIVVDHLNLHKMPERPLSIESTVDDTIELAQFPNVAVKASALPFFTDSVFPFPDLKPIVASVVEAFGAERVFWGSDLSRLPCSYSELVRFFTAELDFLSTRERQLLLGDGISEWLGWER